ncbi:MAG: hypothetical protein P1P76_04790 [Anaerolineales bacterium]|nr:hypothetical protein [Anaerolineales bacterium]
MPTVAYSARIEDAISRIAAVLNGNYSVSKRSIALLLLAGDEEITTLVAEKDSGATKSISGLVEETQRQFGDPLAFVLALQQRKTAEGLVEGLIAQPLKKPTHWRDRLSQAMINPITGLPILMLTLIVLYWFVGVFGAQTLVNWLEGVVFERTINPWINRIVNEAVPWAALRGLLAGEYGILTRGYGMPSPLSYLSSGPSSWSLPQLRIVDTCRAWPF